LFHVGVFLFDTADKNFCYIICKINQNYYTFTIQNVLTHRLNFRGASFFEAEITPVNLLRVMPAKGAIIHIGYSSGCSAQIFYWNEENITF